MYNKKKNAHVGMMPPQWLTLTSKLQAASCLHMLMLMMPYSYDIKCKNVI